MAPTINFKETYRNVYKMMSNSPCVFSFFVRHERIFSTVNCLSACLPVRDRTQTGNAQVDELITVKDYD